MRSAVVTGSSSGIGKAIAARLLGDGWHVVGLDLAPPAVEHTRLTSTRVDLGDLAARDHVIESLEPADALVHAAGIMRGAVLGALDHAAGEMLWRIHVDAAMALADQLAPRMRPGGRIVLIGSRAAQGVAGKSQYGAAKAALVALARSWAKELVTKGVTVNVVAPAATETAMLSDPRRTIIPPETPPIGRRTRPEEIAALVTFLLSGDADAITGQEIAICGGASL
jgi:3-oxoacyl-[acyl-carrier protein] reductase